MGDKTAVTLTFLSDHRAAEAGLSAMEKAIMRAEIEAARLGKELSDEERDSIRAAEAAARLGRELSDVERAELRAGVAAREHGERLTQVGERFDQLDTRAMGARDAITAVQDSGSGLAMLAKGDLGNGLLFLGQGLADAGSAGYNTIIPMFKDLISRMGAARLAMLGAAGAAGIVAAGLLFMARDANRFKVDLSHAQEDLIRFYETGKRTTFIRDVFGDASMSVADWANELDRANTSWTEGLGRVELWDKLTGKTDAARDRFKAIDDALAEYVDTTRDAVGAEALLVEELGASNYQRAVAEGRLPAFSDALKRNYERTWDAVEATQSVAQAWLDAANNLQTYSDLVRGQTDKVFAYTTAVRSQQEAQDAYNEALKENGPNSREAADALRDLEQANLNLYTAATDAADVNRDELLGSLQQLKEDGWITEQQFHDLAAQIDAAKSAAERADGTRTRFYIDEYIRQHGYSPTGHGAFSGKAGGGPVTAGTPYMVGEVGPELFVPAQSGTIVPNSMIGGGSWSGPSAAEIATAVAAALRGMSVNLDGREVGRVLAGAF